MSRRIRSLARRTARGGSGRGLESPLQFPEAGAARAAGVSGLLGRLAASDAPPPGPEIHHRARDWRHCAFSLNSWPRKLAGASLVKTMAIA